MKWVCNLASVIQSQICNILHSKETLNIHVRRENRHISPDWRPGTLFSWYVLERSVVAQELLSENRPVSTSDNRNTHSAGVIVFG